MNVSSTTLGTVDIPAYSIRVECNNGGSAYSKLDNSTWDWNYTLTKTNAPTVSIFFLIDQNASGTVTLSNTKDIMMNREELTVSGSILGDFKMIPLTLSWQAVTNEKNVIKCTLKGDLTEW